MNRRNSIVADMEKRQSDNSTLAADGETLRGLAIPFGKMSANLGGFVEVIFGKT